MSDQCKYCSCHQDIDSCMATDCSIKDSWYAKRLEAENASLRRKNELLCQTVEKSVLLSRIEEIINGTESAPDADYYGEWDDGMYVSTPSDVLMYLNKALETPAD